jgi:hypothetical protein
MIKSKLGLVGETISMCTLHPPTYPFASHFALNPQRRTLFVSVCGCMGDTLYTHHSDHKSAERQLTRATIGAHTIVDTTFNVEDVSSVRILSVCYSYFYYEFCTKKY